MEHNGNRDTIGEGLWASILALSAKERLTESATDAVLLTAEVTATDGQSVVLIFRERNVDSYAVCVLDRVFLVDAGQKMKSVKRNLEKPKKRLAIFCKPCYTNSRG